MSPIWMAILIIGLTGAFIRTANRRWQLLQVARGDAGPRFEDIKARIAGTLTYAFAQKKMGYYPLAGLAHKAIFFGFLVLLLRTLILWGRGFSPSFNLFILGHEPVLGLPLGHIYEFAKDVVAVLVVLGASVFLYYRIIKKEARMAQSGEAVLILGIIMTMMIADMMYDGAAQVLRARYAELDCGAGDMALCGRVQTVIAPLPPPPDVAAAPAYAAFPAPAGSFFAQLLAGVPHGALVVIAHIGFWIHASLVLIFLNLLPLSKHFHVITAIPNVFTRDIGPKGRAPSVAKNSEALGLMVEKAFDEPETAAPIGFAKIEDVSWKAVLDFYTCTECGRCSDNCPAHTTGKMLSPRQLTINLRDHLYEREEEYLTRPGGPKGLPPKEDSADRESSEDDEGSSGADEETKKDEGDGENPKPDAEVETKVVELVPNVIHPDVLWACTTCRACEEQCPVMISYVDKIIELRRNLVLIKGEFPGELNNPFSAMETNGNPWNLARMDRGGWSEGLEVPTMADNPKAKVLYWVGCAASYDDRAKKVARAMARLLKMAGVDFAILGEEETCTGDPARRAGNEYLFMMLAEQNVEVLNGYKEKGGIKKIVTACPHCFNSLANEYPDFDAKFEVVHHTDYLLGLLAEKKLKPKKAVKGRVVFHDSCYLGRYNDVYEQPRDILKRIPGVELVEAEGVNREKGLCCGAGGAQMWMEEQNKQRVNQKRTLQLLDTGAKTIATGCPFCMTMITDGLKAEEKEASIRQLDVVELLDESCTEDDAPKKKKVTKSKPSEGDASASA